MLELRAGGGEEFFYNFHVVVHGPAHVEKQDHLDRVAPLGPGLDVEIAMLGRRTDRAVEVQLLRRAVPRPLAQALHSRP